MKTLLRTRLRPMIEADIPQVGEIERASFPSSWPQTAYKRELQNTAARYLVLAEVLDEPGVSPATPQPQGLLGTLRRMVGGDAPSTDAEYLLGFVGVWLMVGEAHIVTIAVRDEYRRMGIGERLLIACIELAMQYDQEIVTLEVRRSNIAAQQLYEKYRLAAVGVRRRYYTDNHEDAVIMTSPEIASPAFRLHFGAMKQAHQQRYPDLWA